MGKIKDFWQEAEMFTEESFSPVKTIIVFVLILIIELIVGPIFYWWLEGRKIKK